MPKLSIVVPVYNVGSLVKKCIESLLNQSFSDIEVLIINDGSTDDSVSYIEPYLENEKVKYYYQNNQGLGKARNVGLELSSGEWITFVDSDDWVDLDLYTIMINRLENDKSDIAICSVKNEYSNYVCSEDRYKYVFSNTLSNYTALNILAQCENNNYMISPVVWNKVYRKSIILNNNIRFLENSYWEDDVFTFQIFMRANMFERAQYILDQRADTNNAEREIVMTTKGRAMLSGLMFCAHCGCRLTSNVFRDTYTRTDGTTRTGEYLRYICYHKSRKLCECDGQSTYTAAKVDEAVYQAVMDIFSSVTDAPDEVALKRKYDKEMSGHKAKITKLNLEIKRYSTQLEKLNAEIADSLTGDSVYTPEQLSTAINSVNTKLNDANSQLEAIQNEIENQKASMEKVRPNYDRFIGWAGEFASATVERKKMIISQLVKRIEISKGYKINIEMNMDYEQFCEGWNGLKEVVTA